MADDLRSAVDDLTQKRSTAARVTVTADPVEFVRIDHALRNVVASRGCASCGDQKKAITPGRLAVRIARSTHALEPFSKPYAEGRNAILLEMGGTVKRADTDRWAEFENRLAGLESEMRQDGEVEVELFSIRAELLEEVDVEDSMLDILVRHGLVAFD